MLKKLFICYARLLNIAYLLLPFLLFFYKVDIEVRWKNQNAVETSVENEIKNVSIEVPPFEWVYTCTEDGVSKELLLLNAPKPEGNVILGGEGEKFSYSKDWVKDHCTYEMRFISSK
jgi:hypothetical protein